jgi:hypothetical protein
MAGMLAIEAQPQMLAEQAISKVNRVLRVFM